MNEKKEFIEQVKEALTLARQALEFTETNIGHPNFEVEEDALIAIDFALERICGDSL